MLDKNVPYIEFYMERPEGLVLPSASARSDGFFVRLYEAGDEKHWARIETSVGEFDKEEDALNYFAKEFAPQPELLRQRMCFVCTPHNTPVATCTAWEKHGRHLLHWVATEPAYQRRGLARLAVVSALHRYPAGSSVILHTQTWSHAAVRLYKALGFDLVRDQDTEKALAVLQKVYDTALYEQIKTGLRKSW